MAQTFAHILAYTYAVVCCVQTAEQNLKLKPELKHWKQSKITEVLHLDGNISDENVSLAAQQRLLQIYQDQIRPLEEAFRFSDLNQDAISEGEIFAKPMILFLGPWSTGKSTMINYLIAAENLPWKLHTGAEPTTSDFTVLSHGPTYRIIKGIQLISDKTKHYLPLQTFGLDFLERFQGVELPSKLLEHVTLVDTPGIIENKKQQERGYPFNDVCQWFIDRAQLIFLIFDPTKLDIGSELEALFNQLKGHEAKLRFIMNKADTITTQELMHVYGALFWSLAPMVREVEPPRVYVGSMWSKPYRPGTMHSLFEDEETTLLNDLYQIIRYQMEHKIAATRRHAFLVRLHALVVDSFLTAFANAKGLLFGDNDKLWKDMLENPVKFSIMNRLRQHSDVSIHDLPSKEVYQNFFSINDHSRFKPLSFYCSFWSGCIMEELVKAINVDLPNLLSDLRIGNITSGYCSKDSENC